MKKRVLSILCVWALLMSFAVFARAESDSNAQTAVNRYNVMLVVDGSDSLIQHERTDENGVRYDALKLFLGLLTESGNNVGAIVFDDTIMLDTGILEMENMAAKLSLANRIQNAGTGGYTDIGSAMLQAVNDLEGLTEKNGLPSIILLFSDGNTSFDHSYKLAKSQENAAAALEKAKANDIVIHSIWLNANGAGDSSEITTYTSATGGSYEEVSSAEDLSAAFRRFYTLINKTEYRPAEQRAFNEQGNAEISFSSAEFGIEEVNIVVEVTQPLKGIQVIRPDGRMLSDDEIKDRSIITSRYHLLKIPYPENGNWTVCLSGEPGNTVDVSMLYNFSFTSYLEIAHDPEDVIFAEPFEFTLQIFDDIQDKVSFSDLVSMDAVLNIYDTKRHTTEYLTMEATKNGNYTVPYDFEPGAYSVFATIGCGTFVTKTNEIDLSLEYGVTGTLNAQNDPRDSLRIVPHSFAVTLQDATMGNLQKKTLETMDAVLYIRDKATGDTIELPLTATEMSSLVTESLLAPGEYCVYAEVGKDTFHLKSEQVDVSVKDIAMNAEVSAATDIGMQRESLLKIPFTFSVKVDDVDSGAVRMQDLKAMECVLSILERETEEVVATLGMKPEKEGYYSVYSELDTGTYVAYARLSYEDYELTTDEITIDVSPAASAVLSVNSDSEKLLHGKEYSFTMQLSDLDVESISDRETALLDAVLHIFNEETQQMTDYSMTAGTSGEYLLAQTFTDGSYTVSADLSYRGKQIAATEPAYYFITNGAPVPAEDISQTIQTIVFKGGAFTVDLSTLFTDPEGDMLAIEVVSNHPEAVHRNGDTITVECLNLGREVMTVKAVDELGAESELHITLEEKNLTILVLIVTVVVLLLVLVAVVSYIRWKNNLKCKIEISLESFNDNDASWATLSPLYNFRGKKTLNKLGTVDGVSARDYYFEATKDPNLCYFRGKKTFYDEAGKAVNKVSIQNGTHFRIYFDSEKTIGLEIETN